MPVPTYDRFIEPLLRFLVTRPEGVLAREAHEAVADALKLSDQDRLETVPTGQPVYNNRAGWAHDRLKRAGLSSSPKRGVWKVTDEGRAFLAAHGTSLTDEQVLELARGFLDVRLRPESAAAPHAATPDAPAPVQSPDDRLKTALDEIRTSVAGELLEILGQVTPKYFETIVLDVLHKLGYGASRDDLRRVGGSGDAGIDGVISLDKLGLERVYVQAKRWQDPVGRPQVQGFFGALAGQRANKGIFITTSSFSAQAREFADSVDRIVLVDGPELAQLMIDYDVGITSQRLRVPKIDSDYIDE
jgi:restriction system protein